MRFSVFCSGAGIGWVVCVTGAAWPRKGDILLFDGTEVEVDRVVRDPPCLCVRERGCGPGCTGWSPYSICRVDDTTWLVALTAPATVAG